MFKTISVLLPTRGRVASLTRLIRSLRETVTDWSEVELLFRCDDDDMPTIEFLRGEGFEPLIGPRYRGYVSMPIFLKELMAKAKGDVIFPINDDGEFFTKDWPKLILEAANRYPDGIFNFGAETGLNSYIHPFPIMSRQYVEAIGHIGNEELYWIDVYQLDIARAFDRVIPLKSVVYKHYWFEETQANPDATRREAQKTEMEIVFDINKKRPDKPIEEFVYEDVFWNWREEYKAKHDAHVKLAVERVKAALNSGKFGKSFNSIGAALSTVLQPRDIQIGTILTIGSADPKLGGIEGLAPSLIARIEEAQSPEREFEQHGDRLVCRGDISDFAFLYRVARRVGEFNTLVIWGPTLARCVASYFFFRRQMAFPGTVVLVSAEPGDGVERFVKKLANGEYDQLPHELQDLPILQGHMRVWIEIVPGVPKSMPVDNPTPFKIPERKKAPPRPTLGYGSELIKIGEYNVVKWLDRFYAIPSGSTFQMDVAVRSWEEGADTYIIGESLAEVESKLGKSSFSLSGVPTDWEAEVTLARENVAGHNIIKWGSRFYGLAQSRGDFRKAIAVHSQQGGPDAYVVGSTSDEVEWKIRNPSVVAPQSPVEIKSAASVKPRISIEQPHVKRPAMIWTLLKGLLGRHNSSPMKGLFDRNWYIGQYRDVAAAGIDPFKHYLEFGAYEGRNPHALFDTKWYLSQNLDVASSRANPLVHYVQHGAAEGRSPHPLFDSKWYLAKYPDIAAAKVDPLKHYLSHGGFEGRDPHPLFDSDWYLSCYSDIAAAHVNPLKHYVEHGAFEGRDPNPLFDSDWYLSKYPDVASKGINPLAHYVMRGGFEGRDPNPLFDSDWYLFRYPDVAAARRNPLQHYLEHGASEGRSPNSVFDSSWYLAKYNDVAQSGSNPLGHYIRHGADEGRDPSPEFDSDWYLWQYPDVAKAGLNPLVDYLHRGRKAGLFPNAAAAGLGS